MKPVIIVPYKNRKSYLDILLKRLPTYLNSQGIADFRILVCEQLDNSIFNSSISRNVGLRFALEKLDFKFGYFIINDVDIIPVDKVDYHFTRNSVWFGNPGGMKLSKETILAINGYNPVFFGWGREDAEIWDRLSTYSIPYSHWPTQIEAKNAKLINLEWKDCLYSKQRSNDFFYCEGPEFINYSSEHFQLPEIDRPDKYKDFYFKNIVERNKQIFELITSASAEFKQKYYQLFGMNQINLNNVFVETISSKIIKLSYYSNLVNI